jgi:hypothetical protein
VVRSEPPQAKGEGSISIKGLEVLSQIEKKAADDSSSAKGQSLFVESKIGLATEGVGLFGNSNKQTVNLFSSLNKDKGSLFANMNKG